MDAKIVFLLTIIAVGICTREEPHVVFNFHEKLRMVTSTTTEQTQSSQIIRVPDLQCPIGYKKDQLGNLHKSVNGDLVKDFLEKVHETRHKIREDVKNVLHLNKAGELQNVKDNDKDEKTTTETITEKILPTEVATETVQNSTEASTTTTAATNANTTSTEKDGRENFTGGCATGYQRTADGRCKPTF